MAKKYSPGTYLITSIQATATRKNLDEFRFANIYNLGAPNKKLISGFETYCETNDGELLFLTMNGMNTRDNGTVREEHNLHRYFDDYIYDGTVLFPEDRNIKLNKNCFLADWIVPPQNMDPSTSRTRLVQTGQTTVYAHSKQRLRMVPSGPGRLPKMLVTTGAATHPNYNITNHKGDMAAKEHKYGAVVVEIIDKENFNIRILPAFKNGKFVDLGYLYDCDKKSKCKIGVEALVLGDIHKGDDDPKTMAANYEMIEYFEPNRLFLHDLVNGHSVNPHERNNLLTRVREFENGRLNIEEELKAVNKELHNLSDLMQGREINVVFSNHDFFLERYLESGTYLDEPWNTKLALRLAHLAIEGYNPVEEGIKMMGDIPSNINFLELNQGYRVRGYELGAHGHKGISGARGSIRSREEGFGKSITGHTHSPEIQRNTIIVGTSTKLDLPYTEGSMSKWLPANAVLYDNGLVQLIPIINGKWKMKK